MTVAGLVLAAGAGRRFGQPKATVELDGELLVVRAARVLREGGCHPVAVVLGAAVIDVPGADLVVRHDGWAEGLGSSLRAGLEALEVSGADAAVVVLCDQPGLGAAAVAAVAEGAPAGPAALAVATFGGVRGHPVLVGADHWAGVAALAQGDVGARAYLDRHPEVVTEIACDGLGDPADVDRPEQLARWAQVDVAAPSPAGRAEHVAFSERLEQWLTSEGPKTIGNLGEVFAEKSFAVTILFLMFVPALPLPTGGISHLFEAITIVVAAQMVLGRSTLWLPERWKRRELGSATLEKAVPFIARRIRWFERFSRPRAAWIFRDRLPRRFLGLLILALALAAALSPPFSGLDTIPSMGAVTIALAIILEDAVVLAIGTVIGAVGVAISVALGAAAASAMRAIF